MKTDGPNTKALGWGPGVCNWSYQVVLLPPAPSHPGTHLSPRTTAWYPLQHPATRQRVKRKRKRNGIFTVRKSWACEFWPHAWRKRLGQTGSSILFFVLLLANHFNAYYYREWQYHMYHITIALSLNIQLSNFSTTWRKYFFHIVVSLGYLQETFLVFFLPFLLLGNLFWVIHLLFSLSFLAGTMISPCKIKMIKILTKIFAAIVTNLNLLPFLSD